MASVAGIKAWWGGLAPERKKDLVRDAALSWAISTIKSGGNPFAGAAGGLFSASVYVIKDATRGYFSDVISDKTYIHTCVVYAAAASVSNLFFAVQLAAVTTFVASALLALFLDREVNLFLTR